LQKLLGRENLSLEIISSITLFIISFFFIFWIASYFEVDIFPLENRAIYYTTFDIYIFDKYGDTIIISLLTTLWLCLSIRGIKRIVSAISYGSLTAAALLTNLNPLLDTSVFISIPLIASFFIYQQFSTKKIIQIQTNLIISFFSLAILCIAVSGLIITLLSISSSSVVPEWIRNHAVNLFLLFSSFSPALILFLVVGSIIKSLKTRWIKDSKSRIQKQQIIFQKVKVKRNFLFLSLFILLSISFALIPHQSFINNENEIVGADTVDYVQWLNNIQVDNQGELIHRAFVVQNNGDRPLSLLLFSGVLMIFPDNPYQAIDHLPIILSPLLVLTVFFLTREITSNDTIALLSSFLTAITFQALIGIYGGLYSNWLALILGYSSIVFLLRFLKKPTIINYLVFSVLFFVMMLSHIYTWTLFTFFLVIFLIISYRLKMFERKRLALVFLILVMSIAFDTGKSIMTDTPFGIERDVSFGNISADYGNLFSAWSNLSQTSHVYLAGIFGNFLILSLCIFWLLKSNLREMPNLFFAIFLSIAIIPILLGDEVIQSRVMYNIPFQIPAAIGLVYLANQHRGTLLIFAISIWILTMSIQTLVNFI